MTVANPVAGGTCIARNDGQVIFVRGALPGETAVVSVTGSGRGGGFLRADAIEIVEPSADRVTPPCPIAGECGGCDWQHAALPAQRRIKAAVITDALRRTGAVTAIGGVGLDDAITVEAPDDGDGFGWRTRMRFAIAPGGELGLRRHESHQVLPAAFCPLMTPSIRESLSDRPDSWPAGREVLAASDADGAVTIVLAGDDRDPGHLLDGEEMLTERAAGRSWQVRADGFWQVHPAAADLLARAVIEFADVQPGDSVLDLYSGVGLFAGALAELAGATGHVIAVEGDEQAVASAHENLADLPQVTHVQASVAHWLADSAEHAVGGELIVLDPPRSGAGGDVAELIAAREPRAVVYVACDPVALARDIKTFAALGYVFEAIRCFDIFPMTKHVECVALFRPAG